MEGIADFLDSLIGGIDLVCYAMTIGGLFWAMVILQPWNADRKLINQDLLQATIGLIYKGALALATAQLLTIILKILLITAVLEKWPFPEFATTSQFIAGIIRFCLSLFLARYCYLRLKANPYSHRHWQTAGIYAIPLIISGAWLVHGASRFENTALLMSFTVLHQLASAAWVGSVFQLINLWRLHRKNEITKELWGILLRRFSKPGIYIVGLIVVTGTVLSFNFIDTWNGFFGTGYGNLIVVKIMLLALALVFAWLNRTATIEYFNTGKLYALYNKVPHYVEAETFVLIALLFTAASLASQPPAIDLHDLTATWREVLHTFAPRIPRISSPSHEALIAGEAGRIAIVGQIHSEAATAWSDYNHNIAGIFLTIMSLFAMLSYKKGFEWARYWPIGFIALGIFLFFRSDAETWPLGPIGFWESTFSNSEVLQHRIATILVLVLGYYEIKARLTTDPSSNLPYFFPVLAAFGGLMLLTHSHVGFQAKTTYLIQISHTLMGVFALILAIGRWLELKLDIDGRKISGFTSVFALLQIGVILMFYREPLY
jgi:putative copper resistance protein D